MKNEAQDRLNYEAFTKTIEETLTRKFKRPVKRSYDVTSYSGSFQLEGHDQKFAISVSLVEDNTVLGEQTAGDTCDINITMYIEALGGQITHTVKNVAVNSKSLAKAVEQSLKTCCKQTVAHAKFVQLDAIMSAVKSASR